MIDAELRELIREVLRAELADFAAQLKAPARPAIPLVHMLGIEQIAKLCRAKRETVRGWCLSGRLVGRKAGHRWVVRREDLERFMIERAPARGLSPTGAVDEMTRKVRAAGGR